jgi:hypothetical protein
VLSPVFDPLDERSPRGRYGFEPEEFATPTCGQQAVFNLRWLRDFIEGDSFLANWDGPGVRAHAVRLKENARLAGPRVFAPLFGEMVAFVGAEPAEPPFGEGYLFGGLEGELFALEEQRGRLRDATAPVLERRDCRARDAAGSKSDARSSMP